MPCLSLEPHLRVYGQAVLGQSAGRGPGGPSSAGVLLGSKDYTRVIAAHGRSTRWWDGLELLGKMLSCGFQLN
eukprot:3675869-Alexandrium_andersonii.AAC.1